MDKTFWSCVIGFVALDYIKLLFYLFIFYSIFTMANLRILTCVVIFFAVSKGKAVLFVPCFSSNVPTILFWGYMVYGFITVSDFTVGKKKQFVKCQTYVFLNNRGVVETVLFLYFWCFFVIG